MSGQVERLCGNGTVSKEEIARFNEVDDAKRMILARMWAGELDDSLAGAMARWSHFLFGVDTSEKAMQGYFMQQSAVGRVMLTAAQLREGVLALQKEGSTDNSPQLAAQANFRFAAAMLRGEVAQATNPRTITINASLANGLDVLAEHTDVLGRFYQELGPAPVAIPQSSMP